MRKIYYKAIVVACAGLAIACSKNETPDSGTPEFQLLQSELNIPVDGGYQEVGYELKNAVSSGTLRVEVAPAEVDWIKTTDATSLEGKIVFNVSENTLPEKRSATMTVTYAWSDGEISQELAVTQYGSYDFDLQLVDFYGVYNGTKYSDAGNYTTILSTVENPYGMAEEGGMYYGLDIYSKPAEDPDNALPAPGTYTVGGEGVMDEFVIGYDYSYFLDNANGAPNKVLFNGGSIEISYDGADMIIEGVLTDQNDKTHHIALRGDFSYENQSVGDDDDDNDGVLMEDKTVKATDVVAGLINDPSLSADLMRVDMQFTDMEISGGNMVPPGSRVYITYIMPKSEEAIVTGTYKVSDTKEAMTLIPGALTLVGEGYYWPMGSYIDYMYLLDNEGHLGVDSGYFVEGTLEISGTPGNYKISAELITEEGITVTLEYEGKVPVPGIGPYSTLTDDYELDLSKADGTVEYYGNTYGTGGNWMVYLETPWGVDGDGFMVELVTDAENFDSGISTGTYKVSSDEVFANAFECVPGSYGADGYLYGTNYYRYDPDLGGYGDMAPAIEGNLDVTNNGDGSYSFEFSFVDDLGHTWSGSWSGKVLKMDYSAGGFSESARKSSAGSPGIKSHGYRQHDAGSMRWDFVH